VAIGDSALYHNRFGGASSVEAKKNTAIGSRSLFENRKGYDNTAIGNEALYLSTGNANTAVGDQSLRDNTTGYSNAALGRYSLESNTIGGGNSYSNSTAIGANATITASNQVRLGNSSVTSIGGYAAWSTLSSKQSKTSIKENVAGLDFILKLRPVTYKIDKTSHGESAGLKTEEANNRNSEKLTLDLLHKK
jgi:hypothetical protein